MTFLSQGFLLVTDDELGGEAGNDHDHQQTDEDNQEIWKKPGSDKGPGIDESRCRGDEHDGHGFDEEMNRFTDLDDVEEFLPQKQEEQQDPVNAGGNGKGDKDVEDFSRKGQGDDDAELS